jgi:purine nucleosidase
VLWQERYGKWRTPARGIQRWWHEPFVGAHSAGGAAHGIKPSSEDAVHFLIRMVHKYPHEVTIYEGGPMTNLALATTIDPQFPELAQELVFMGGSLNPNTKNPEWANALRATSSIFG